MEGVFPRSVLMRFPRSHTPTYLMRHLTPSWQEKLINGVVQEAAQSRRGRITDPDIYVGKGAKILPMSKISREALRLNEGGPGRKTGTGHEAKEAIHERKEFVMNNTNQTV